jgi:hypothetical protein
LNERRLAVVLLLACAMLDSVLVGRLDRGIADAYIAEDGPAEMFGAVCLLLGAAFAGIGFLRCRGAVDGSRQARVRALSFLALTVFLFIAAGEELSWGQRLFGFGTPDRLASVNAQGETTLHNLYGDDNGQNASARLFQVAWISFGVVVPLAAAVWAPAGRFLRRIVPVAPVWLALLFIGQQALWQPVQADFRRDPAAWNGTFRGKIGEAPYRVRSPADARERGVSSPAGLSEVMETNIELLLAVGAFCVMSTVPRRRPRDDASPAAPSESPASPPAPTVSLSRASQRS